MRLSSEGRPFWRTVASRVLSLAVLASAGLTGWANAQLPEPTTLKPRWQHDIGSPMNQAPLVAGGRVFVIPQGGVLQAFDIQTGQPLWSRPRPDVWERGLSAHRDLLVVCLTNAHVAALEASTGREIWRTSLAGINCQRPAVHQGDDLWVSTTYVGGGLPGKTLTGAKLFKLDLATGAVRWAFKSDTYLLQTAMATDTQVFVGGSYLDPAFVAEEGGAAYYYALDRQTGRRQWRFKSVDGLPKSLYAHGQTVAYVAYEDFVQALDTRTGRPLWRRDSENWTPAIVGESDHLYLGTANTFVHDWDLKTGRAHWRFNIPGPAFDYLLVRPTLDGASLWFLTQTGQVFALDKKTGQSRWHARIDRISRIDPAFSTRSLVVGDIDGRLSAFDLPDLSRP
jgi:outer membrane protein assembly factor BamB